MTQLMNTLRMILVMLPVIMEAVKSIELMVPAGGQGASKLAIIREALAGSFDVVQDAGLSFEKMWPAIERVINAVVALFNKSGQFK